MKKKATILKRFFFFLVFFNSHGLLDYSYLREDPVFASFFFFGNNSTLQKLQHTEIISGIACLSYLLVHVETFQDIKYVWRK